MQVRTTIIVPVAVLRRICDRRIPLSLDSIAVSLFGNMTVEPGVCVDGWFVAQLDEIFHHPDNNKILHSNELGVGWLAKTRKRS